MPESQRIIRRSYRRFLRSWFDDPFAVGAVAPSGRPLARMMTREVGAGDRILELGPGTGTAGGPVSLASASETELQELPGIGPSLASAIVAHRDERGPFRTVDDLLEVPGIGPAKLEGLRDQVVP